MSGRVFLSIFFIFSFSVIAQEPSASVTVGEYADFLNAVAATDSHTLYHEAMSGIVRTGQPGDYQYEIVEGAENLPITFVTWLDAARYCNWKEHRSPTRDEVRPEATETGSYTLNDAMSGSVIRNQGAHYFLPMQEEDIPVALLADASLHFWGANREKNDADVPLFHHDAVGASTDEESDPSLAANGLGFYVLEAVRGDQFNAANFLQSSQPDDGTLSTFDKVIGAVGVLALLGGGYAYYRSHAVSESAESVRAGGQQRQAAELEQANRDREEEERKEDENPSSQMVDDVTGTPSNTDDFKTDTSSGARDDQRSFLKKIADGLRNRDYVFSIYQNADQIDYIAGKDPLPQNRTCWQNFIRRMTQSCYPYKDIEDFKKRNTGYLQQQIKSHEERIEDLSVKVRQHEATIVQHGITIQQHEATIARHGETQQQRAETETQAREARLDQFQKKQERLREVTQLILTILKLEPLCYSAPADVAASHAASSAVAVQEASLTPFQMLREATQYFVIVKLLRIEKTAQRSQHITEEEIAEGQIQTQHHELCKAHAELMERLATLASKKELLWRRLEEMQSDFINPQHVAERVQFIAEKLPGIQSSIQTYKKVVQERFEFAKGIFEGDEKSNASRESADRRSIGSAMSDSVEKDKKHRSSFGSSLFGDSAEKKAAKVKAATEKDLQIETACRELGERIQKHFTATVDSLTDRVEKFFTQSYEMLHLAERNALLGRDLMSLLEADQGKKLWETSSLRPYLVDALTDARTRVGSAIVMNSATGLFAQEKVALVGTWEKQQDAATVKPIYHHQGGGWEKFSKEEDVTAAVEGLKRRNQLLKEDGLILLTGKIDKAKTIAQLLETAAAQANELFSAPATTLEEKRAPFLAAMNQLLQHSILEPTQSSSSQASADGH